MYTWYVNTIAAHDYVNMDNFSGQLTKAMQKYSDNNLLGFFFGQRSC